MGTKRYEVEYDDVDKWFLEEMAETIGGYSSDPVKCIITDRQSGDTESAVGDGKSDALEKACRKLGISTSDLEDELEEDD